MNGRTNEVLTRRITLPHADKAERALARLSPFERVLFWLLVAVFVGSTLTLLSHINTTYLLTTTPSRGGTLTEGVIGPSRFINPLLAISDADQGLVRLVYSGLMRTDADGTLVPALAKEYHISEDGLTYTFTIRKEAEFHDGTRVTAEDVVFTVKKAQDPAIKSPRRANWTDVEVTQIDEETVQFTLQKPYSPFLENTTMGILPKHIWSEASADELPFSQYNVEPIGSGPYKVAHVARNDAGVPSAYTLLAFRNYIPHQPYISKIIVNFYPNEDALIAAYQNGDIESVNGISPELVPELPLSGTRLAQAPLLRVFGVFFNQNQAPVLANKEVRRALDAALNKQRIVEEVLAGYGTPLESPIPPGVLNATQETAAAANVAATSSIAGARAILTDNGWERGENGVFEKDGTPLAFSIATSDTAELKKAAQLVQDMWRELGADVAVEVFDSGNLNQNVIRPRQYDALLFGEIVGRELDLFAFWHSSQRNDPGLNVALYANIDADAYLEGARTLADPGARAEQFEKFEEVVQSDVPAVFLYSPDFIYVIPEKAREVRLPSVTTSGDRFLDIHNWYIETEHVWPFFVE